MSGNDVMYDVGALTYVVLSVAKKNASLKTKAYLRPSDAINEVSHKPMSLQRGSKCSFERKNRSCDLRNILETESSEL